MIGTSTWLLALLLSLAVGASLGFLGGGGSILTTPILLYVLGMDTHEAIATSLLVVGGTSAVALIPHARGGRVRWKTGALFGVTSMAGAYAAGRIAHLLPGTLLLLGFGAMMLLTALAMMRKRAEPDLLAPAPRRRPYGRIVVDGLVVGAITGLIGAGGGFLVVPALVLLGGLSMRDAVGTSLLVIALKAFAAFVGHAGATPVHLPLAGVLTVAAIVGSLGGSALAGRAPQELMRRGFAWFIVVMAVFLLSQEVPAALGHPVDLRVHWGPVVALVALPAAAGLADLRRQLRASREASRGV